MNALLMSLDLVAEFINTIAETPAANSFLTPVVDEILKAGAALVLRGDEAATELQALTQQIRDMANAGRDPTDAEWDALKARSDAAHQSIQNAPDT